MGKALELNDDNFAQVLQDNEVVMVDFWAEWCGPCKMIGPSIEELASEFEGRAVVAKMDVDNNTIVPSEQNIRSIPAIFFFKNGKLVDKQIGVPNNAKSVLLQKLSSLI
ncbi:MAG: thioredoxin [Cytophagia bacterium]|nr:MAG: thioredoxin [Cytophagia bacterium]TAG43097.1 MAG: thioredoxin [Cytophagia bacterium]